MALTIWLVRHGETQSNQDGVFQGHLDVALSERGEEQARRVGVRFANETFDAVYASDLQRAARTAELITGGAVPIVLDQDLREMHYGILQGVRYRDAARTLEPHGYSDDWTSGRFHRRGLAAPGGESLRQLSTRSRRFLRRIDEAHFRNVGCDQRILVVAHGGKLAMLVTALLGLPMAARLAFRFGNCSLTQITRTEYRTSLDFFNALLWDDDWPVSVPATVDPRHERGE